MKHKPLNRAASEAALSQKPAPQKVASAETGTDPQASHHALRQGHKEVLLEQVSWQDAVKDFLRQFLSTKEQKTRTYYRLNLVINAFTQQLVRRWLEQIIDRFAHNPDSPPKAGGNVTSTEVISSPRKPLLDASGLICGSRRACYNTGAIRSARASAANPASTPIRPSPAPCGCERSTACPSGAAASGRRWHGPEGLRRRRVEGASARSLQAPGLAQGPSGGGPEYGLHPGGSDDDQQHQ